MDKVFFITGAGLGLLGVALGAFGAHGLAAHFAANPDLQSSYDTATRYLIFHALALLAVAWAMTHWSSPLFNWAGGFMVAGVLIFSGSLYVLSLTGVRWLGAITPLGGVAFLAGWLLLMVGAWRG